MKRLPLIGLTVFATGCSLALDTEPFRTADASVTRADGGGEVDAGLADGGRADAGLTLAVTEVQPPTLLEGVGSGPASVRGTAVWVKGQGLFVDDVRSEELDVIDWQASADGTQLGISVRVPVDTQLNRGAMKQATLTLSVGGRSVPAQLQIEGLDEKVVRTGDVAPSGDNPQPYSVLTFEGGAIAGLQGARWYATSLIEVQGALQLSGQTDGSPGAGGCAGGLAEVRGGCDGRGGGPGASPGTLRPTGGGGAGNRTEGEPGGDFEEGPSPGLAGTATTGSALVGGLRAYSGAGGGGGGGSQGGVGGGGGGALALVSRGRLTVDDVQARGGPGQPLSSPTCDRAGGGGGSGGVLVLRAWQVEGEAILDVRGGSPGGVPGCENRGGAGGAGYVWLQTASSTVTLNVLPADSGRLGPTWAPDTEVVVSQQTTLKVRGVPGQTYWLDIEGQPARSVTVPSRGDGQAQVDFGTTGVRQVCLRRERVTADALEGRDCLAFAVLP